MLRGETILNIFIGISIIFWGIAGMCSHYINGQPSLIRLLITGMNIIVGLLIIFRKPIFKKGSLSSIIISLPAAILGGLAFKLAKPEDLWLPFNETIFLIGSFFTLISFIFLGKNFSIFPSQRSVVSTGTYNFIRHPGYLGELIMTFACTISQITLLNNIIFILFLLSLIFRINEEEKLLSHSFEYIKYKEKVKWKLFPYLW